MNYHKYQHTRDLSWELLKKEAVGELPVRISSLCRSLDIGIKRYSGDTATEGQCLLLNGRAVILVNADRPISRQRFTAAHELGHVLLGHVGQVDYIGRELFSKDDRREQAADLFAIRVLAPACVLWGCGVHSVEEVMALCDIDREAAQYRYQRLQMLIRRDKFLTAPLEKEVYLQFSSFMAEHRAEKEGLR